MFKLTFNRNTKIILLLIAVISVLFLMINGTKNAAKEAPKANAIVDEEAVMSEQERADELRMKQLNVDEIMANLPSTLEKVDQIVKYPVGPYSGRSYQELTDAEKTEILQQFEQLSQIDEASLKGRLELSKELEAYWRLSYSLFHENYPGPDEILKELNTVLFGRPDHDDDRYRFKEHLNVEIILDSSGSMAKKIDGKSMMDMAKDAIREFTSELPKNAKVALRVYGHKGGGSESDKAISCASNELVYDLTKYRPAKLNSSLRKFKPSGWTPLAKAIEEAQKDLAPYDGKTHTNIIYLVSDGIETCGGDPVKAASEIANSEITPIINIIGFNVDSEGQRQLRQIADAAKGTYTTVLNQQGLSDEFDRSKEIAKRWEEWVNSAVEELDVENDQQWDNIFNAANTWLEKNKMQRENIIAVIDDLHKSDQISEQAADFLKRKANDQSRKILKLSTDLRDGLWVLKDKQYVEVKEEIEKLFDENVTKIKKKR